MLRENARVRKEKRKRDIEEKAWEIENKKKERERCVFLHWAAQREF